MLQKTQKAVPLFIFLPHSDQFFPLPIHKIRHKHCDHGKPKTSNLRAMLQQTDLLLKYCLQICLYLSNSPDTQECKDYKDARHEGQRFYNLEAKAGEAGAKWAEQGLRESGPWHPGEDSAAET